MTAQTRGVELAHSVADELGLKAMASTACDEIRGSHFEQRQPILW